VYIKYPSSTGLVIGIFISAMGLMIGILIASRIGKKHGTVDFISSVTASPELDNLDKQEK
jgi:ABC-type dipeptide/oligopeptide/nickel transport system permease subunit